MSTKVLLIFNVGAILHFCVHGILRPVGISPLLCVSAHQMYAHILLDQSPCNIGCLRRDKTNRLINN